MPVIKTSYSDGESHFLLQSITHAPAALRGDLGLAEQEGDGLTLGGP